MRFTAQVRRSLLSLTALVSVFTILGHDIALSPSKPQGSPVAANDDDVQANAILTGVDKAHYRQAFMLQRTGRFAEADRELSLTGNHLLVSTVMAERYQSKRYTPRYNELVGWLAANANTASADAIYRLALAHKPAQANAPEEPAFSRLQKNFSNKYARSNLRDNKNWQAGLAAFKHKDMTAAAHQFRSLADEEGISSEDKAASSFWAYRALKASGQNALAEHYLDKASDCPSGFYSLLARGLTGENKAINDPVPTSEREMAALRQLPSVKRAVALKELGESALVEAELRMLYTSSSKTVRNNVLVLAKEMGVPATQMHMAGINADGRASYPMPDWQPSAGYQVERALLFAIMRQESGFDPNARSASGAVGLMQLMPATAYAMAHEDRQLGKSHDPAVNMTLGQRYLEHLMSTPHIGDNLIYLTAAYNAGPGSVANWLQKNNEKDPLLFVETLPFAQTREYVVHVVANYWVYSQLSGVSEPTSLTALAGGEWPHYEGAERQLVALLTKAD